MRLIDFCRGVLDIPAQALIVVQTDLVIAVGNPRGLHPYGHEIE